MRTHQILCMTLVAPNILHATAQEPASAWTAKEAVEPRADNKTICKTERSDSGLITNWYCAGERSECCKDNSDSSIGFRCIAPEDMCCGNGEFCFASLGGICMSDGDGGYECLFDNGLDLPADIGRTPEFELDRSNVDGNDGNEGSDEGSEDNEGTATKLGWHSEIVWLWGIGVGFLGLL
ncbi:hypothetical protein BDW02DRAFT_631364 [Decorospora gaudefroyi]|uniref:Uncharacterized protein n=1 Tax=Decorospora gaudefroyi TaxID=184978 RepID=A0A6A5KA96_9PLEO|nr:hypothetical protein BDW02DRAFT_631364 [Decorospora gaudefroyi]